MPLLASGLKRIRLTLQRVEAGERPPYVPVATFTAEQLQLINKQRALEELAPIDGLIVFNGRHLYKSRCLDNAYSIDEVIEQIESAFCSTSEVLHEGTTVIRNSVERVDREGHRIHDEAIFECHQRHPTPVLFSVVPRGDGRRKIK